MNADFRIINIFSLETTHPYFRLCTIHLLNKTNLSKTLGTGTIRFIYQSKIF